MEQKNTVKQQIGQAWAYHREGRNDQAIAEFETVLNQQPDSVDAHYGMGLALRAEDRNQQAVESFQKALELAQRTLNALRSVSEAEGQAGRTNDLGSTDDDRYMMLIRMIKQRLAELGISEPAN